MDNVFSLEDKVILITGASSGIGRQCAITCSQMGAKVVLIARDEKRLKETLSLMAGDDHHYYSLDITDYEKIEDVIKDVVVKFGKISGFIHSAGIEMTKPLKMIKQQDYLNVFTVNTFAGFEVARILSKKKYRDSSASFVFISSIMSILGQPGKIGYCSSKSAIIGGMKAMALELVTKKIRVNSISPAVIQTDMSKKLYDSLSEIEQNKITNMHPLGLGKPKDVANGCIYLLSNASRWVTGTNLIIDGGYSAR